MGEVHLNDKEGAPIQTTNPLPVTLPATQITDLKTVTATNDPLFVTLKNNPITTDLKLRVTNSPYGYDVAEGNIANHIPFFKTGFNADVDAAEEDMWSAGGMYVFPLAEQGMEVYSTDNTNDKAGGTGALTVKIWYLTSTFVEKSETVTMTGTTNAETAATDIYRVNAFRVMTAGATGAATGTISLRNKTDHTTVYSQIAIGQTRARNSIYTVPIGKTLYIGQLSFSVGHSSGGRYARFTLRAKYDDIIKTVSTLFYPYFEIGIQDGAYNMSLEFPIKFPAGVDIKISVIGDAGNADAICTCAYRGWLES
jgi:hypothetical protein